MEAKECDVAPSRGAKGLEDKMAAATLNGPAGGIGVAPEARRVGNGFRINWMNMRDAATGKILWEQAKGWGDMYDREILARVPRRLLDCRAVSREVNFSSEFKMKDFRLEQRVLLHVGLRAPARFEDTALLSRRGRAVTAAAATAALAAREVERCGLQVAWLALPSSSPSEAPARGGDVLRRQSMLHFAAAPPAAAPRGSGSSCP